jgi:hypothetical protein
VANTYSEQAIDLPVSIIRTIRSSADKVREEFSDGPGEWLIIEDAADKIGVPVWRIREWRRHGYIPYRRLGQRLEFKVSDCDLIRELREEHGDMWTSMVPWATGRVQLPKQDDESSTSIAARIFARAKSRYELGDYEGSAALFMAALEDCELEEE